MSTYNDDYFDEPVYADVEREARADWVAEKPEPDYPTPAELADEEYDLLVEERGREWWS